MIDLLGGWPVLAQGAAGGPAWRAGDLLARLGADVALRPGPERLEAGEDRLTIDGWSSNVEPIVSQQLAYLAAAELLRGGAGRLDVLDARRTLQEGALLGAGASLERCADGWLVVRWRRPEERDLLEAVLGRPLRRADAAAAWSAAADCRLLVAPVRERPRKEARGAVGSHRRLKPRLALVPSDRRPLGVVDWTSLWAGPWATGRLADDGARTVRIEAPSRRDGLLGSVAGRRLWERWNGEKDLLLADARSAAGREAIARAIASSDVLVSAHTPRVLPQLGFDAARLARFAPRLLHVALVAYEPPYEYAPGLGEHGAAVSGLLWGGTDQSAVALAPLADPLLGALVLTVVRAWVVGGRPPGITVRLSLEAAAALVDAGSHRR